MKTTMADIAKKLGVHPSTVSLALKKSPKISESMTAKIHKTAEAMGYQVNPYVAALMSSRRSGNNPQNSPVIAMVTGTQTPDEWKSGYNASEFVKGCSDVARNLGIRIEHFWIGDEKLTAKRLNDILCNRGIRGAVLLKFGVWREKMDHSWSELATVSYGIHESTPTTDWVTANHYGNMEIILEVLKGQNFKRIGFAMETPYSYSNQNRWLASYLMEQRDEPLKQRLKPWLDPEPTFEGFKAWYGKEKPEVIICVRPPKVISWLEQMGLHVPEDVGVVTLGTSKLDGEFSGIVEKARTCGKLALELLLERIHQNEFGELDSPHHITVSGQWNRGETLRYRNSDA